MCLDNLHMPGGQCQATCCGAAAAALISNAKCVQAAARPPLHSTNHHAGRVSNSPQLQLAKQQTCPLHASRGKAVASRPISTAIARGTEMCCSCHLAQTRADHSRHCSRAAAAPAV